MFYCIDFDSREVECRSESKEELDNGMEFSGYVDTNERDELLKSCKLLVDPSWSKSYSQFGSHFNRVMVEAMSLGCVPVCTDLGMKDSVLFKAGLNYLEIPYDCSSQYYGSFLQHALKDDEMLHAIQENNLKLAEVFDRKNVAAAILEFSFSTKGTIGSATEKLELDCDKKMKHFEDL